MRALANSQAGRHPVTVLSGTDSLEHDGTVFHASNGIQTCFAAFNYSWQCGPAVLLLPALPAPVAPAWAGMLHRIAAGCGAGFGGSEGSKPPMWLPTPCQSPKTDTSDALDGLSWGVRGVPAPFGCIGKHPATAPNSVTLLVGDRASPKSAQHPDWPFVSLLDTGCAHWLSEGVDFEDARLTCWVNAYRPDGSRKDLSHLRGLPWRQVIAFGNYAEMACHFAGIEAKRIHHPMHWFRKHRDKPYQLSKLLKGE